MAEHPALPSTTGLTLNPCPEGTGTRGERGLKLRLWLSVASPDAYAPGRSGNSGESGCHDHDVDSWVEECLTSSGKRITMHPRRGGGPRTSRVWHRAMVQRLMGLTDVISSDEEDVVDAGDPA
jgi:hypothetical protein